MSLLTDSLVLRLMSNRRELAAILAVTDYGWIAETLDALEGGEGH